MQFTDDYALFQQHKMFELMKPNIKTDTQRLKLIAISIDGNLTHLTKLLEGMTMKTITNWTIKAHRAYGQTAAGKRNWTCVHKGLLTYSEYERLVNAWIVKNLIRRTK